jgi:hypothetical protein
MASGTAGGIAPDAIPIGKYTPLNRQQIVGFWAAWFGWMLDGMDSVIYALVLGPALTELLPRSGMEATPANIGYVGSLMFGLFLVGWGLSFIWGPISDKFGRTKSLAATILVYAVFTGAAAFSTNVWMLAVFRFLAGIGVGGEWAMAGTYVAEAWPEDRRKMGKEDELLTEVRLPLLPPDTHCGFYEFNRRAGDFSTAPWRCAAQSLSAVPPTCPRASPR